MSLTNEQKNKIRRNWVDCDFVETIDSGIYTLRNDDVNEIADFFLSKFDSLQAESKEELKGKIEELIQKERFAGAPHALNEVLKIIK